MNKNSRIVSVIAIASATVIILALSWENHFSARIRSCDDGPHTTMDIRDFVTQYSGYSVEFEASIANRGQLGGKLEPHQLQQLSEASQTANEFRKWLVAGYNACAITKAQFADFGVRFQHLDQVSRQINAFSSKAVLTPSDSQALSSLVEDYRATASRLGQMK
jgi:hypothetical protein